MYKLEYLETAKNDIDDIIYYVHYILNNKKAAKDLANTFIKEINNILNFPYGNAEYIPIKPLKYTYRRYKIKNFLVFYIIDEKNRTIIIARVLYKKMDINQILN